MEHHPYLKTLIAWKSIIWWPSGPIICNALEKSKKTKFITFKYKRKDTIRPAAQSGEFVVLIMHIWIAVTGFAELGIAHHQWR